MEFLLIIIKGITLGITLSLVTGPALFALMQTSLTHGFKAGVRFAFGISISDVIMVFLSLFGISTLLDNDRNKLIFAIVGGVIMIVFGVLTFLQQGVHEKKNNIKGERKNFLLKFMGKGFLFNIANPAVWFYWLIPVGIATSLGSTQNSCIFLVSLLGTTLSCDILKCAIAYKLKTILVPKVINIINKIVGVILIIVGLYFIIDEINEVFDLTQKILNK